MNDIESGSGSADEHEKLYADDAAALERLMSFSLSADFLRRLIERSNRAFFVFAPDGTQTYYVSPAFDKIWRRPRAMLYRDPTTWYQTLHPDDRERVEATAAQYLNDAAVAHPPLEYRIVLPQGGFRWIWGYLFLCEDGQGRKLLCGISEDVTEAKQAAEARDHAKAALEETVQRRTAELTELNERLQREVATRKQTEESLRRQRDYLKQLIHAQDLERRFISYDIHDGAIQNVIAARMHLETALEKTSTTEANGSVREAHRLLQGVLEETRRIIAGIRPPTLDDLGVGAALEEQVEENARQGLDVDLHDRTRRARWSPSIEMTIYRVVQESLANVRRHGDTDRARVDLDLCGDQIGVTITDWGRGFDVAEAADREFGLHGIRERVAAVGGCVSITSEPGKGTVVYAVIPSLDPEQAAAAQRARAERALQISRNRMEAVLDRTPAVVFIKDHDGRYEFVNRKFEELFHVERSAFVGTDDRELFPPEIAAALRENDRQVLEQSEPLTIEESVPSDGDLREYLSLKFPIPGEAGTAPSLCGIATDITERKRELLALRDTQNRFQSFMDHLPMLAWIKDAAGKYVYGNRRMLDNRRLTFEQLIGKTDFDLFPEEVAKQLREHDRSVLTQEAGRMFLERAPAAPGEAEVIWQSFKFPMHGGDGSTLVGGVAFDVRQKDLRSAVDADERSD